MSTSAGPNIVEDGLVLYLDAANENSYPGTGTTWTDLSGNANNGTLINGVGYSSNNQGYLSFDGVNDYVTLSSFNSQTNPSISLFSWIFLNTTSGRPGVWGHKAAGGNNCHLEVLDSFWRLRIGLLNNSSITSATTNAWQYIGFSYTGSSVSFFINGKLISSWSGSSGTIFGGDQRIGESNSLDRFFNGYISNTKIYNKALSESEIKQNFNALRGRYGI